MCFFDSRLSSGIIKNDSATCLPIALPAIISRKDFCDKRNGNASIIVRSAAKSPEKPLPPLGSIMVAAYVTIAETSPYTRKNTAYTLTDKDAAKSLQPLKNAESLLFEKKNVVSLCSIDCPERFANSREPIKLFWYSLLPVDAAPYILPLEKMRWKKLTMPLKR